VSGGARALLAGTLGAALVASVVAAPADPATDRRHSVHTVAKGDTLAGIARRYGVSVPAIVAANRLPSERATLRPGQRLAIPMARGSEGTRVARKRAVVGALAAVDRAGPRSPGARSPLDFVMSVPEFADTLGAFVWPAEGAITSPFGRRRSGWHRGIDIRADQGEPVMAAAAGVVVTVGVEARYGRVVKVEHEYGFTTVYAHNSVNLVEVGDWVLAGQRIAKIGRTGRATNYHLHFEIRREGRVYNPLYMLPMPARVTSVEEMDEEHDE
jgi:murein DD-endopeptidase MepM/ murein hydrolase activator NlpD